MQWKQRYTHRVKSVILPPPDKFGQHELVVHLAQGRQYRVERVVAQESVVLVIQLLIAGLILCAQIVGFCVELHTFTRLDSDLMLPLENLFDIRYSNFDGHPPLFRINYLAISSTLFHVSQPKPFNVYIYSQKTVRNIECLHGPNSKISVEIKLGRRLQERKKGGESKWL